MDSFDEDKCKLKSWERVGESVAGSLHFGSVLRIFIYWTARLGRLLHCCWPAMLSIGCTRCQYVRESVISALSGVCCWYDGFDGILVLKGGGKSMAATSS